MNVFVLLLIAAIAGVAIATQGQFIGAIDRALGPITTVFITYAGGGLLATLIWLFTRRSLSNIRDVPWYSWTAGLLGLIIVGAIGYATPRLGLSRAMIVIVGAQLLTAVVIDHFGLFGAPVRTVDLSRAAGVILAFAGVWLVVRG